MSCADDGHCITCSDEGIPMRVLDLRPGGLALCVGEDGAPVEVMIDLVERPAAGESLLVHAGVALGRLA
ncbi:MAG: HypC/HybG/HupF family hydrogenase formation chaperone [Gaiellaceae bacterium]